jgi:hypothetical protein
MCMGLYRYSVLIANFCCAASPTVANSPLMGSRSAVNVKRSTGDRGVRAVLRDTSEGLKFQVGSYCEILPIQHAPWSWHINYKYPLQAQPANPAPAPETLTSEIQAHVTLWPEPVSDAWTIPEAQPVTSVLPGTLETLWSRRSVFPVAVTSVGRRSVIVSAGVASACRMLRGSTATVVLRITMGSRVAIGGVVGTVTVTLPRSRLSVRIRLDSVRAGRERLGWGVRDVPRDTGTIPLMDVNVRMVALVTP